MNYTNKNYFQLFKNSDVTIIGLGVSNKPLLQKLLDSQVNVTVRDKRKDIDRTGLDDVNFYLGDNYLEGLSGDIIFRTPGLRPDHPSLLKAKAGGSQVTSEVNELLSICPCPVIGITGSDGKTTTTSLISEILKLSGYTVHLGGNIGIPLLTRVDNIDRNDIVVLELSSFQLIDMTCSPSVSVITNITPNHLDWHLNIDEYIEAKSVVLKHQKKKDTAVLNADNIITASMKGNGNTVYFGKQRILSEKIDGIFDISKIQLKGYYQIENCLAAITAVTGLASYETIKESLYSFKGVPHRNEYVTSINGVSFYNNSIGTTPARTIATLKAHDRKVILIAGGRSKNIPFDDLCNAFPDHVKALILIGEAASDISNCTKSIVNTPSVTCCNNMEDAVYYAYSIARPGDIVLLSPACSSYDVYNNFEERGNHFIRIVESLY